MSSFLAVALLVASTALGAAPAPSAHAQAALNCTASATNVVGAHAGSLSIRVGATVTCDRPATVSFTLPGGTHAQFDTDASGQFMGIAGDAYLCQGQTAEISVLARASDGGTWLSTVPIDTESGAPSPNGFGPSCDVLLQPNVNFVAWGGPLVAVADGLSQQTLGRPLPHSDNSSTNPLDHIAAVLTYDAHNDTWLTWFPGAPAFTSTLKMLSPGTVYAIRSDADIPLTYPPANPQANATSTATPAATPTPSPTP